MKHVNDYPLVSVLMTAYNREKYIGEAIESVLNQTYGNWELIITDDCSKDNTLAIARGYEARDSRIHVYLNEKNLGDYPNRNRAASYAKGKYLKYLDADDMLYPWALFAFVSSMEACPEAGWGMCVASEHKRPFPFVLNPTELYESDYSGKIAIFGHSPLSAIIRRDVFNAVGGFTGKQHLGDFELWHILGRSYPIAILCKGFGWWRLHEDQQMNDNRVDPFVGFKYHVAAIELLSHPDCPINSKIKEKAIRYNRRVICRSILKMILKGKFKMAKKMSSFSGMSFVNAIALSF